MNPWEYKFGKEIYVPARSLPHLSNGLINPWTVLQSIGKTRDQDEVPHLDAYVIDNKELVLVEPGAFRSLRVQTSSLLEQIQQLPAAVLVHEQQAKNLYQHYEICSAIHESDSSAIAVENNWSRLPMDASLIRVVTAALPERQQFKPDMQDAANAIARDIIKTTGKRPKKIEVAKVLMLQFNISELATAMRSFNKDW